MTSPFRRPTHTAEEIAQHLAEAVARKLEGTPKPKAPPYTGHGTKSLARQYELEIDISFILGWGDPATIEKMKHHAKEAVATIANNAAWWERNTEKSGGVSDSLSKRAGEIIEGLRTRIDPALKVAEAEFDPDRVLRSSYDEIESEHLGQVEAIKKTYCPMRKMATPSARKKLRDLKRKELQDVLDSMAAAVREWSSDLDDACKSVGLD